MRSWLRPALTVCLGLAVLSEASASAPASALDPARTPALSRVRIQHQIDTVELYKRDGRWWVADRDVPARAEMMTQTLRQLEALEAHSAAPAGKKEGLEAYGLQLEAARFVRLQFSDGEVVRLRLGTKPEEPGAVYWAHDAGDPLSPKTPAPRTVYRGAGFPVGADLDAWVYPLFFDADFARAIKTVRVEWRDSTGAPVRYALTRSADTVALSEPPGLQANAYKAAEAFAQATSLLIDGFAGRERLLPASGTPRVRVKIETANGKSISLSADSSDDFHDYVRHPDAPHVLVKMRRVQLDSFKHTPEFLATSYPYGPDMDDGISGPPPPHFGVLSGHCYHGEDEDEHELYHEGTSPDAASEHEGHRH